MSNPIFAGLLLALLLAAVGAYWLIRVSRPGVTDSAWYWGLMFCGLGLIGLLAIGPKYYLRELRLERQLEARTEIHRRRLEPQRSAAGESPSTISSTADDSNGEDAEFDPPLLKTLAPLVFVALLGAIVSAVMLRRELKRESRGQFEGKIPGASP